MYMRKLILFLSVVATGLFLTSCLEAGDSNLAGSGQLFYITLSEGTKIAHNGGFAMTSNEIKMQEPERWYLITWSWTTANGMLSSTVHNAITTDIEQIPCGQYLHEEAPEGSSTPINSFGMISRFPITGVFGDFLILQYSWAKKEGESVEVRLYNETMQQTDQFTLELRLEKSGTATGTTEKNEDAFAAIKMDQLRNLIDFNGQDYKDIQLKFNYLKGSSATPSSVTNRVRIYKQ
jgi:hypothetical protein